ncbi:glucose-6-phosphate 1-dehydrogenase [Nematocida minor]|uniref:glucose-6-phosphate 1-dehydrogenase n=1 Tax=Nematocida minor TaxID=1912983 RepID=UPI00221EC38C|nr:glucose-6-phosphate 1-dehydrogenase [Nematocida minor]KAI5192640.1 glucose-6-phosphate 1-dehydrogenase [Nematocida minor]
MLVIAGCTGDLSKKKIFPAINKVFRRRLSECTGGAYAETELNQTDGTLSSSTSAHNLSKYSPITIANPEDPVNTKKYVEATASRILHRKMKQGDILKNNGIIIPRIMGYARSQLSTVDFIRRIDPSIVYLKETVEKIEYHSGEYDKIIDKVYEQLEMNYKEEKVLDSELYIYLAVPPEIYPTILGEVRERLQRISVQESEEKGPSDVVPTVLIEKPVGTSLETFLELKEPLQNNPDRFLCIDHYLFKNVIVRYKEIYNASVLKDMVVPGYVKEVKGYFNEVIGVEGREGYYNTSGACRDVLQNHLLLSVATVLAGNGSRMEILKKIEPLKPENTLFGVYAEYADVIRKSGEVPSTLRRSLSETSINREFVKQRSADKEDAQEPVLDPSIKETFIKTETEISEPWSIPLKMTAGKRMPAHFVAVILILTDEAILKLVKAETHPADYENTKLTEKIEKMLGSKEERTEKSAPYAAAEQGIETEESQEETVSPAEKKTQRKNITGKIKVKITPKESISIEIKYKNKLAKKVNIPIPNTEDNIDAYEHLFNQLIFQKEVHGFSSLAEIESQWRIVDPILDHPEVTRILY